MKLKILVALALSFAACAETARADTSYGGVAVKNGRQNGPAIGLTARADGTVTARVLTTYDCGRRVIYNVVVKVTGRLNGAAFTATGKTGLRRGVGPLRATLTGTLTPDAATGRIRLRSRCLTRTRDFLLRAATAPAGAPAAPPRSTTFHGLTDQSAAGVRLPLMLRVARNGRVYLNEYARADCGSYNVDVSQSSNSAAVKPDGTFSIKERWKITLSDGWTQRYRVVTTGRFLAGGATGTVRLRVRYSKGRLRAACDTGTVTWSARP